MGGQERATMGGPVHDINVQATIRSSAVMHAWRGSVSGCGLVAFAYSIAQ